MKRIDGRKEGQLRNIQFQKNFQAGPKSSILITWGETRVLCSVCVEPRVPPFLMGKGTGWLTAEYDMLPGSSNKRIRRDRTTGAIKGRSQEIQRLIGRSLRQCIDLKLTGERTFVVDCDVLTADGGTRVAAITCGAVALRLAIQRLISDKEMKVDPFTGFVGAVSVGLIDNLPILDLNYEEDSSADVDMNIVASGEGELIEVQATAEGAAFSLESMDGMTRIGLEAILCRIIPLQKEVVEL